ncbi:MAG: 50S ribosomal protein L6 [Candidatus Doudnabacteria bacterium RIFCSPLOWO2_02_FULL_42_9]|uniref:Large ribosomal subunit protein uL6 n=1 Tax=Candidatus Doudnabacteria bacterium RIFCSPHIGHO2_01_FULL_41_86 TaxID=1817821 RepID=A0A1F5N9J9_9BACT|nr:ribosomal protein L6 [uncultured bacterium]OGE74232.1 MAG: 50S ribosomal protein L6 [Candidatus Doudnabacteria bacterium RIFCSPHIGHO2_01_FULL_41_86]OGE75022.1 MAG: 50S ribosomal protein L6 [Candidatus Doudnabacteria bacterium RIFCSPHIGHO2_01_43_10]OGE85271.1 MAG: 50S ribosomal protein L6 [Candidatus Doudnabacteria bacterium RIFCSPHIGHO2_12_FULL_42_22]OGE86809.1 MAG: 50S ribosomal protein L6 [Candidatus Doudnabacteria bacterium RIFCSPHIGHO2_02_FULL_42_25]OGE92408.1 MAG: 50S ribosomal protein
MSRIGKKPVTIPSGVNVDLTSEVLKVKGPKGELTLNLHPKVQIEKGENEVVVKVSNEENKQQRALWGLYRALINNMVAGVSTGFSKVLEINGVGYKVELQGKKLVLQLGYSHPVELEIPAGLEAKVEKNTITISGIDRQSVGQFAAVIRSKREPEPYKGKGIKYQGEVIRRKAGKVVKAVGGGK